MSLNKVLALAQGSPPDFRDVNFPVYPDLSQQLDLNQPQDSAFHFTDRAQQELDNLPAVYREKIGQHFDDASDALADGDLRNAATCLVQAVAVAHLQSAHHLAREIHVYARAVGLGANDTPEPDDAKKLNAGGKDIGYQNDNPTEHSNMNGAIRASGPLDKVLSLARSYERVERGRVERVTGYASQPLRTFTGGIRSQRDIEAAEAQLRSEGHHPAVAHFAVERANGLAAGGPATMDDARDIARNHPLAKEIAAAAGSSRPGESMSEATDRAMLTAHLRDAHGKDFSKMGGSLGIMQAEHMGAHGGGPGHSIKVPHVHADMHRYDYENPHENVRLAMPTGIAPHLNAGHIPNLRMHLMQEHHGVPSSHGGDLEAAHQHLHSLGDAGHTHGPMNVHDEIQHRLSADAGMSLEQMRQRRISQGRDLTARMDRATNQLRQDNASIRQQLGR